MVFWMFKLIIVDVISIPSFQFIKYVFNGTRRPKWKTPNAKVLQPCITEIRHSHVIKLTHLKLVISSSIGTFAWSMAFGSLRATFYNEYMLDALVHFWIVLTELQQREVSIRTALSIVIKSLKYYRTYRHNTVYRTIATTVCRSVVPPYNSANVILKW